jgi:hypothetical protein
MGWSLLSKTALMLLLLVLLDLKGLKRIYACLSRCG